MVRPCHTRTVHSRGSIWPKRVWPETARFGYQHGGTKMLLMLSEDVACTRSSVWAIMPPSAS